MLGALLLETLCQHMEAVGRDPSCRGNTQTQRPSQAPTEGFLRVMKPETRWPAGRPSLSGDFCFSLSRFLLLRGT